MAIFPASGMPGASTTPGLGIMPGIAPPGSIGAGPPVGPSFQAGALVPIVGSRLPIIMTGIVSIMNLGSKVAGKASGAGVIGRILQWGGYASLAGMLLPGLPGLFGFGSTEQDDIVNLIEEAIESGFISDNRGQPRGGSEPREIKAVIFTFDRGGDIERAYAMDYIPFSKGTVKKFDDAQDTYRRPRRAARRAQGARSRRN